VKSKSLMLVLDTFSLEALTKVPGGNPGCLGLPLNKLSGGIQTSLNIIEFIIHLLVLIEYCGLAWLVRKKPAAD
jgi:hypothetical protein